MFKTFLDTPNFHFEAFGQTKSDSFAAIIRGLKYHVKTYGLDEDEFLIKFLKDIQTVRVKIGVCFRDSEELKRCLDT